MKKLQNKYKELLESTMQYLWREWSSLGVAGALKYPGEQYVDVFIDDLGRIISFFEKI